MSDPKLTIIATKGTLDWAYPLHSGQHRCCTGYAGVCLLYILWPEPASERHQLAACYPNGQPIHANENAYGPKMAEKHRFWS